MLSLWDTRQNPICDSTKSCDSHAEIPLCIVNIVVVLIAIYGEHWLTWLLEVCNHNLPVLAGVHRTVDPPGLVAVPCAVLEINV